MEKNLRGIALFLAIFLMLPGTGMADNRSLLGNDLANYDSMILAGDEMYVYDRTEEQIILVPLDGADTASFPSKEETLEDGKKVIRETMALVAWKGVPHAIEQVRVWKGDNFRFVSAGLYRLDVGENGLEHTLAVSLNWNHLVEEGLSIKTLPNVQSVAIADDTLCVSLFSPSVGQFPLMYQRLDVGELEILSLKGEEFGVYPLDEQRFLILQEIDEEYILSTLNIQDWSTVELCRMEHPEFICWGNISCAFSTGFAANAALDALCWNQDHVLYQVPLSNPTAEPEEIGLVPMDYAFDGILADDGSYYAMSSQRVVRFQPETGDLSIARLSTNTYSNDDFAIQHGGVLIDEIIQSDKEVTADLLNHSSSLDVVSLPSGAPVIRQLVDAGCLAPLDTPALQEYAASLYPYALEGIYKDGVLYALPYDCNARYSGVFANEEMMKKYSVEMPGNWMELLDLLNDWDAPLAEDELLFSSQVDLLWAMLESYRAWWQAEGDPDAYDTPLLRRLLEKFSQTSYPRQDQEIQAYWGYSGIALFWASDFDLSVSAALPLEEGMQPHVLCKLGYFAVNADSENRELAMEFAECLLEQKAGRSADAQNALCTTSGVPESAMEICAADFSGVVTNDETTILHTAIQQYANGEISQDALIARLILDIQEIH